MDPNSSSQRSQAGETAASSTLIAALLNPGAYDHPVGTIELIETHISWVLLTGDFAYRIKKPVDLGFVDFSTLAKRQHFCAEEVRLNRRLAPEFYLGVMPLTGSPDAPRFGGDGDTIEYAVKMRQFSPSAQLDRMLDRGNSGPPPGCLREAHRCFPPAGVDCRGQPLPWRTGTGSRTRDAELPDLRQCLPDPASAQCIAELEQWTVTNFARLRDNFQRRKREGSFANAMATCTCATWPGSTTARSRLTASSSTRTCAGPTC